LRLRPIVPRVGSVYSAYVIHSHGPLRPPVGVLC